MEGCLRKAVSLGYRSHQSGTCGLHIHVSRNAFGSEAAVQEEAIARVLYFVEKHWEETVEVQPAHSTAIGPLGRAVRLSGTATGDS